ncbi:hypothetical protein NLJ89_g5159 [Agrocybe chaxingu]|uniref:Uncharacterized protein n=1 Tax=Agrocybe chaxingu TaxID=84603 RepID=A0A9W8K1K1_9AGAR|nr:hypothetical protein NLJ89_g5159 [Agrocybe chaxingu]
MGVSDTFQEAPISIFQLSLADLWEENTINLLKFRCSEMWDVDTDIFEMHRFPTGYENFLLDFFADPGRPEELRLSSDRYTTLALGCLKYLRRPSRRRADLRCLPFTQWAQKSRNAPWVWRRLRHNPRLLPWVGKQWRYWRRFGVRKSAIWWDGLEVNGSGERLLNELDDSRWSEARECRAIAADERSLPLRAFALALHLLPQLLDQASQSEELVDAVSRGVFHPTSVFFLHRTRRAKDAVRKYLDRANTYISADT